MRRAAALAACGLLGACATLGGSGAPAPVPGYLDDAAIHALAQAAPPSVAGAAPDAAATGVDPGTDRWWLATAHAELRAPEAAQHFDCVLGARMAQSPRPALTRLMNRLLADAEALTRATAERSPRRRPAAMGLQPCQRVNDAMRDSPSWPAGGAVAGAAYGELFATLAPDRADAARRMGREIGRSRAICRMNWLTDVEAGAALGVSLYAVEARAPAFAADVGAARAEVAAARAEGLSNPSCAAERRALDGVRPAAG